MLFRGAQKAGAKRDPLSSCLLKNNLVCAAVAEERGETQREMQRERRLCSTAQLQRRRYGVHPEWDLHHKKQVYMTTA